MINILGDRLKELRKDKKLTQEDIAKMFNVVPATVSAWENNTAQPSIEVIKELAKYYCVSTDYLLCYNEIDGDRIEKLKIALKENGVDDYDKAIKMLSLFMEMENKGDDNK